MIKETHSFPLTSSIRPANNTAGMGGCLAGGPLSSGGLWPPTAPPCGCQPAAWPPGEGWGPPPGAEVAVPPPAPAGPGSAAQWDAC